MLPPQANSSSQDLLQPVQQSSPAGVKRKVKVRPEALAKAPNPDEDEEGPVGSPSSDETQDRSLTKKVLQYLSNQGPA